MNRETNDFVVLKGSVGEIEVPNDEPFKYDELDRMQYIMTLTNIVKSFQNGTVIALNGAWGTGKTTFIRMWKQYLENLHFPVAYYNAWEDDISEEPLFSLLRQLKTVANKKNGKKLGTVLKSGAKILGRITIAGAKASMGKISEIIINAGEESAKEIKKIVEEAGKGGLDAIQSAFEDSLKNEKDDLRSLMKEFRKNFQSYVEYDKKEERDAVPFVYFIDELDRCNPIFAVKVLERIKHLFEVPNVVFVLSVDKKQLELSINGFFGSERFDSNEYLRRFIDIEYNMPHLVAPKYFECLESKYGIELALRNLRQKCRHYQDVIIYHDRLISEISTVNDVSLRQLEKIFILVQLLLFDKRFTHSFINTDEEPYFIPISFFMSYLKVCNNELYQNIIVGKYSLQELTDELENIMHGKQSYHFHYFYENQLSENMEHNELCILLVLAHYCETTVLVNKRFEQENSISKKKEITSFQELNNINFKIIPRELLIKNQSLFDSKLMGIDFWIKNLEMY